ncbi:LysM peptidoglycan-binding domain-containing protein [Cellulosimicrobium marinum]|nr:LysM peptidoglycan-binding domain-containing protein [Cellulosimicrobium marinum]
MRRQGATLLLLLLGLGAGASALGARAVHLLAHMSGARFETAVELLVVAAGALAAAWVAASAALALGCLGLRAAGRSWAAGERFVARHAPAVVRRAARVGVSMTVGAGLVLGGTAAHAADTATDRPAVVDLGWRTTDSAATGDGAGDETAPVDLGWRTTPSAPTADTGPVADTGPAADTAPADGTEPADATSSTTGTTAHEPTPGARTGTTALPPADALGAAERDAALVVTRDLGTTTREVVVVRGDTLWSIAERELGPGATVGDVAAEVSRWHAANQDVVGDDPDLIRPGQVLVPPTA